MFLALVVLSALSSNIAVQVINNALSLAVYQYLSESKWVFHPFFLNESTEKLVKIMILRYGARNLSND